MAARNLKLNCRPTLVSEPVIAITNGRHILQEQYVDDFRCNSTEMSPGQGMMILLTGPNASGKSVYLKQIGLLVYMAHIGSLLPADSATIGLTDRIVTRVMTRETVALQQSTFLMDLQQMSHVLRYATPHSLVLVDEFGKGTDLADGTGLLCASLQHLLDLSGGCPRVVVATHCHELVDQRLVTEANGNLAFKTMKVVALEGALTYCYEVMDGHNSCSFACHIAAEVGFPPAVVERAEHITNCLTHGEPVYPLENEDQNNRTNHAVDLLMAADLDTMDLRQLIRGLHTQD